MGTSTVIAHVPRDNIRIDGIGIEFGTSVVAGVGKKLQDAVNPIMGAITGTVLENEFSSALQYKRTKHPSISMALEFFNDSNGAREDVMKPVCRLLAMAVPEIESMLSVNIPGPTLADAILDKLSKLTNNTGSPTLTAQLAGSLNKVKDGSAVGGENISLSIGTYLDLDSVMIESVSGLSFSAATDVDGYPVHATINVVFRPFLNMYRGDMFKALKMDEAGDSFYV